MRILIIDHHPLFCEILSDHLKDFYPSGIIFEARSIKEGLGLVRNVPFDLICIDIFLQEQMGIKGISLLRDIEPKAKIVIISSSVNSLVAQSIIDQGADGYISKSMEVREIKNALSLIFLGEKYISPCILLDNSSEVKNNKHSQINKLSCLTPRQYEVFLLMAKGLPNKSIAMKLYCTEGTVKLHVSAILRAMNVRNRTEAAQVGIHQGFVKGNKVHFV